jgi:hypothetical protein
MVFDRNPKHGKDQSFSEGARRVADLLWEATGGDVSQIPQSYLENLRHEFSDGRVSMLELIDRVDLGPDATYDDYSEVIELLLYADPARFTNIPATIEIQPSHLQFEIDDIEFDFSEFNFAEEIVAEEEIVEQPVPGQAQDPVSAKMELFLKKVISSVYVQGITEVTDTQGNPPNSANNYLLSEDGTFFSGIFYDSPPNEQARQYPFKISNKGGDDWQIEY